MVHYYYYFSSLMKTKEWHLHLYLRQNWKQMWKEVICTVSWCVEITCSAQSINPTCSLLIASAPPVPLLPPAVLFSPFSSNTFHTLVYGTRRRLYQPSWWVHIPDIFLYFLFLCQIMADPTDPFSHLFSKQLHLSADNPDVFHFDGVLPAVLCYYAACVL